MEIAALVRVIDSHYVRTVPVEDLGKESELLTPAQMNALLGAEPLHVQNAPHEQSDK